MKLKLIWQSRRHITAKARPFKPRGGVLAIGNLINKPCSPRCCEFAAEIRWDTNRGRLARSPYRPSDHRRGNTKPCTSHQGSPADKSSDQLFKESPGRSARGEICVGP